MSRFLEALHSGRVLLMDGAMGTELQKAGLRDGENGAAWNLLHPERIEAVHRAYVRAGAEVLLTNTFLINAASYSTQLWAAGVIPAHPTGWCEALARTGSGGHFRLAAVGPVSGGTRREFDDLKVWASPDRDCHNHRHGEHPAPDAALVETCSTPRVRHAMQHLRRWCDLPLLLSLTFLRDESGKLVTYSGHSPEWFARRAGDYGIVALGVNCGRDIGMDDIIEIIRRYRAVTDLPLFARPNAGTPKRKGKRWVYPLTPEAMAARLPELLEAGVSMVGGCCGTTPEHIAALKPIIDARNARRTA
jgi:5-methyltetrahydrofolate--homocysteine methyltransferase